MRYIAVLLTAISLAGCAASLNENAGGLWGKPVEMGPRQNGSASDPFMAQANVAHPSDASSSKVNGDGPTMRQSTVAGIAPPHETAKTALFVTATADSAYQIAPLDVLEISVFNVPELSKSVQVSETGTVNLPLVGDVPAAGKTPQQLERDLASRLGAKYLQNPQVRVNVKDSIGQRVTVNGAVKNPGVYPIKGRTSLLQVVAMAGGFDDISDSTVLVLRNSNGKQSTAKFNVSTIQKGETEDPPVQAGDKILAGTSAIKQGFNLILKGSPLASTAAQAVPPAKP